MSTGATTLRGATGPAPPAGRIERGARRLVAGRLADLRGGTLAIHDAAGTVRAGDGDGPAIEVVVDDPAFWTDVLLEGSLGAARAWIEGRWRCDDLTGLFRLFLRNEDRMDRVDAGAAAFGRVAARLRHALRANTRSGSRENVGAHYDLGNEFFALFLDRSMTYSSAIFERRDSTLEDAQEAKLDRLCRKLALSPTDHVLEIGTGWGSFAIHAAGRYGCRVTTATISREQHALARERVARAGLEDRVEVLLRDYRDLDGRYDKLVSIEMIEAVGHRFLPAYFAACARLLREDGAMALQAITMPDRRYAAYLRRSDFIQRWVFPGTCCPSLSAMLDAVRGHTDLRIAHLEDIGPHYAETLRRWRARFEARRGEALALGYGEAFLRMWTYYLCYCEAGFEERYTGDLQIVLERPGRRTAPHPGG